jgi:hypothetical protein
MRLITPIQQYSAAAVAILMLGLMAGCATYAPRPLNKSAAPKEGVEQLDHGPDPLPPQLGIDDIAFLALRNNPDLVAARTQRGLAQAQLLAAGIGHAARDPGRAGGEMMNSQAARAAFVGMVLSFAACAAPTASETPSVVVSTQTPARGSIPDIVRSPPQRAAPTIVAAISAGNALQAVGRLQDNDKLYLVVSNSSVRDQGQAASPLDASRETAHLALMSAYATPPGWMGSNTLHACVGWRTAQ